MGKKHSYESEIVLGQRYRHIRTGFTGTATSIGFFENACERATLEASELVDGKTVHDTFDTVDLEDASTGERATAERPGGPRPMPQRR